MRNIFIGISFILLLGTVTAQDPCDNVRLYFPQLKKGEVTAIPILYVGSLHKLSLTGAEDCKKDADYDLRGYTIQINGKTIKSVRGYEDSFFPKIYHELERLSIGDKFTITAKVSMRIDGEFHKHLMVKRVFTVI